MAGSTTHPPAGDYNMDHHDVYPTQLPDETVKKVFDALALKADEVGWGAAEAWSPPHASAGVKVSSVARAVDDTADVFTLVVYNEADPSAEPLKLFPCVSPSTATASEAAARAAVQQGMLSQAAVEKVSGVIKARLQGHVAPAVTLAVSEVAGIVFHRPATKQSSPLQQPSAVPDHMKGFVKLASCGGAELSIASLADVVDASRWLEMAKQSSGVSAADTRAVATAAVRFFENMHYLSGNGAPARAVAESPDIAWALTKASCATQLPTQILAVLHARRDQILAGHPPDSTHHSVYSKLSHKAAIHAGRRQFSDLDATLAALELLEARVLNQPIDAAMANEAKTSSKALPLHFPSLSVFDEVYLPPSWSRNASSADVIFRRKVSKSEVIEVGDITFTEGELEAFCLMDLSALEGQLGEEVVQGLKKEPVAVFHSLPAPHKTIVAKAVQATLQLSGDNARQLEMVP